MTPGGDAARPFQSGPRRRARSAPPREAGFRALYGVETKRVNKAVRNNPAKFPPDYLFELDADELDDLRTKVSFTNTSFKSRPSKAFTEKGEK